MEPRKREIRHYTTDDGTNFFQEWLLALKDLTARAAILKRLARVEDGLFGDHRFVGGNVWELRIHIGPGYRVYYGEDGPVVVILILGGDKGSQKRDIRKAQECWDESRRTP